MKRPDVEGFAEDARAVCANSGGCEAGSVAERDVQIADYILALEARVEELEGAGVGIIMDRQESGAESLHGEIVWSVCHTAMLLLEEALAAGEYRALPTPQTGV